MLAIHILVMNKNFVSLIVQRNQRYYISVKKKIAEDMPQIQGHTMY